MALKVENFIKWPIKGGYGIGQVVNINDETVTVRSPLGQVNEITNASDIEIISEEDYRNEISDLADVLAKKGQKTEEYAEKENKEEDNKEDEDMNTEAFEQEISDLKAQVEALESKVAEKDEAIASVTSEKEDLEGQLANIEKERLGNSRANEIRDLGENALNEVNEDSNSAVSELSEMTEDEFTRTKAFVSKIVTAAQKLTEKTQTNETKLTDETQTDETKLTEASVREAEAEEDDNLGATNPNSDEGAEGLTEALASLFSVEEK